MCLLFRTLNLPFKKVAGSDIYRVLAAYDNSRVFCSTDSLGNLERGQFYEAPLTQEGWLTSNEQILVAQFKRLLLQAVSGGGVGPQVGDPFMMVIRPWSSTTKATDLSMSVCAMLVRRAMSLSPSIMQQWLSTQTVAGSLQLTVSLISTKCFPPDRQFRLCMAISRERFVTLMAKADSGFGIYVLWIWANKLLWLYRRRKIARHCARPRPTTNRRTPQSNTGGRYCWTRLQPIRVLTA